MGSFDIGSGDRPTSGPAPLPRAIREETARIVGNTIMVDDASELNAGYCRQLAEAAASRAQAVEDGPIELIRAWQGMGSRHFFLQKGETYHDAERPDGVPEMTDLPFFSGPAHDVTVVRTW